VATKTVTGHTAGSITIGASTSGLLGDSACVSGSVVCASDLAFTSSTANLASGVTRDLKAEVRDYGDNLVSGDNTTSVSFAKTGEIGRASCRERAESSGGDATEKVNGHTAGASTDGDTGNGVR